MASEQYDFLFRVVSDTRGIEQAISAIQRLQTASQRLANLPTVGLNAQENPAASSPARRGTFGQPTSGAGGGIPALPIFRSLNTSIEDLARAVRRNNSNQEAIDRARRTVVHEATASARRNFANSAFDRSPRDNARADARAGGRGAHPRGG